MLSFAKGVKNFALLSIGFQIAEKNNNNIQKNSRNQQIKKFMLDSKRLFNAPKICRQKLFFTSIEKSASDSAFLHPNSFFVIKKKTLAGSHCCCLLNFVTQMPQNRYIKRSIKSKNYFSV